MMLLIAAFSAVVGPHLQLWAHAQDDGSGASVQPSWSTSDTACAGLTDLASCCSAKFNNLCKQCGDSDPTTVVCLQAISGYGVYATFSSITGTWTYDRTAQPVWVDGPCMRACVRACARSCRACVCACELAQR